MLDEVEAEEAIEMEVDEDDERSKRNEEERARCAMLAWSQGQKLAEFKTVYSCSAQVKSRVKSSQVESTLYTTIFVSHFLAGSFFAVFLDCLARPHIIPIPQVTWQLLLLPPAWR